MPVDSVTTFRTGHYDADGALVLASLAYPTADVPDPQAVADRCARAADTGCMYAAGTFLVWADHGMEPSERIELAAEPDGRRGYGI